MKRILVLCLVLSTFLVGCETKTEILPEKESEPTGSKPAICESAEAVTDQLFEYLIAASKSTEDKNLHKKIIENLPAIDWKIACEKYDFTRVFDYLEPYISAGEQDAIWAFLMARKNLDGATAEGYSYYLRHGFLKQPDIIVDQLSTMDEKSSQEVIKLLAGELYFSGYPFSKLEDVLADIKGTKQEIICRSIKDKYLELKNSVEK